MRGRLRHNLQSVPRGLLPPPAPTPTHSYLWLLFSLPPPLVLFLDYEPTWGEKS